MLEHTKRIPCPGCGASFLDVEGSTHRYMESSPGCWAAFGEVLAREYSDPAYFDVHRLTVDAYAVQHPGRPSPQSIKSVGIHLVRLCLLLEHGLDVHRVNKAMPAINRTKEQFVWLTPPPSLGAVTVTDVREAKTAEEHKQAVWSWAQAAWSAWSPHYATVRSWLTVLGDYQE